MPGLARHGSLLVGRKSQGLADAAIYSGIATNPTVYAAPAGRVPGSVMVAMVLGTDPSASPSQPAVSDGHWASCFGSPASSGNWSSMMVKRIADGTSADNLSVTKGTIPTAGVYIAAFVGYTNVQNLIEAESGWGASPRVSNNVTGGTASSHGLEVAMALVAGGGAPHAITGPGGTYTLVDARSLGGATDPTAALYTKTITAGSTFGVLGFSSTGAAGSFVAVHNSLVLS